MYGIANPQHWMNEPWIPAFAGIQGSMVQMGFRKLYLWTPDQARGDEDGGNWLSGRMIGFQP